MNKLPKLNFQLKKMSKKKKFLLTAAGVVVIAGVAVFISVNGKKNQKKDALNLSFTVETAFDSLKNQSKSKDEANENYEDAKDDLDDAESDLSKATSTLNSVKAQYDAIADELKSYPANGILNELEESYNNAVTELSIANAHLAVAEKELADASEDAKSEKETAVKEAKKAVADQEANVKKTKEAYDLKASRYNELLSIESAYKNAQTSYSSAQSEVSKAEQALTQAENTLEQAKEKLDSSWETYDDAVEKAEVQEQKEALEDQLISQTQEEKTIEQYSELIEDCVVKASMSGVITSLNVTEGNVFEGGNVYTIQDNEHFIVTSSVDEYDIASIEKGMPAYIKTDATKDVEMTGEVTYVAIAPTSSSGSMGAISNSASYTIKVSIDEADKNIRAGMTAKVSISLEESADALTVPYDAVTTTPDGTSMITVDINGEKRNIIVETGLETNYYTEIISDEISEGMTVYLTTPMVTSMPAGSREEDSNSFDGLFNGGGMPSGGGFPGGGSRPSGGSFPSGGPGGF